MIDPELPVPLHEQLAGILEDRISSGELTGRLPSIRHLTQEYGISHRTAERALNDLRDAGLAVSVLGRGYFVAPKGV